MNSLLIIFAICLQFLFFESDHFNQSKQHHFKAEEFVCLPCGFTCDKIISKAPGICSHCKMDLVKRSGIIQKNILPQDLLNHIQKAGKQNIILVDVRTAEEFTGEAKDKFGRLKNAVNISLQDLENRINELAPYKNKETIVYCSHAHRSPQAAYILTQNGFTNVYNMEIGMYRWKETVTAKRANDSLFIDQEK